MHSACLCVNNHQKVVIWRPFDLLNFISEGISSNNLKLVSIIDEQIKVFRYCKKVAVVGKCGLLVGN